MKSEISPIYYGLPMFEDMKAAFQRGSSYQQALDANGLLAILDPALSGIRKERPDIVMPNPLIAGEIVNGVARVTGAMKIEAPINALVTLYAELANKPNSDHELMARDVRVGEVGYDLIAQAALKKQNIKGQAEKKLASPNATIWEMLVEQLGMRNAQPTGLTLHLEDSILNLEVSGTAD